MADFHLSVDGPHSDDYTRHVAQAFAEAVRVLNHATLNRDGVTDPATVHDVLGSLRDGIQRLEQTLHQLDGHLARFDRDDLAHSGGGNPGIALGTAHLGVIDARAEAAPLAAYLDEAYTATSGLYLRDPKGGGHDY